MSAVEDYLLSVMDGRPGVGPAALRVGLAALAETYRVGLEIYLLPFQTGIRRRRRIPCPVLSIGNLTAGGTGKTPLTQWICRALVVRGLAPAVLSRGYRGREEHGCAVVSDRDGVVLSADAAGDEAFLLASTLPGVPVIVGKDRRVTGRLAVERFGPDLLVLDDGFQFWQLHRDLDIVLLDATRPFGNGWTFPRGLLREPASHLRRAAMVVLTRSDLAGTESTEKARAQALTYAPEAAVFEASLDPIGLQTFGEGVCPPLEWLSGRRVAALSAVGNPKAFEATLAAVGADVVRVFRFRDHAVISAEELTRICREADAATADAVITTEKDAVKFLPAAFPLPVYWLSVEMRVRNEQTFCDTMLRCLRLA